MDLTGFFMLMLFLSFSKTNVSIIWIRREEMQIRATLPLLPIDFLFVDVVVATTLITRSINPWLFLGFEYMIFFLVFELDFLVCTCISFKFCVAKHNSVIKNWPITFGYEKVIGSVQIQSKQSMLFWSKNPPKTEPTLPVPPLVFGASGTTKCYCQILFMHR